MAGAPDQVAPGRLVERAMREVAGAARRDRRERLAARGAGHADAETFAGVDALLQRAVDRDEESLLLPELLDDQERWRLQTALRWSSHRPLVGPLIVFVKRSLLLPALRWLFDYSQENFRRQQRINAVLAAAVEELAAENARLRRELARLPDRGSAAREGTG